MDVRFLYFDTILVLTASKKQGVKRLRYSQVVDFKVLMKFISHL